MKINWRLAWGAFYVALSVSTCPGQPCTRSVGGPFWARDGPAGLIPGLLAPVLRAAKGGVRRAERQAVALVSWRVRGVVVPREAGMR